MARPTFGIRLLDDLGPASHLVDLAVRAEGLGFDAVWYPHDAFRLHSWPLLAATAARTERVRLGVRSNVYTMDPSEIACFGATLEALAPDRVMLGLGLHTTRMLDWVGIQADDPIARTREAADLVRSLLRGESAQREGTEFSWTSKAFLRAGLPTREIPIYIAAFGADFLRLSGEIGDGSLPMITPPESATVMVNLVNEGAQRVNRDPRSLDLAGFVWISVDEDGAAARAAVDDVVGYFGSYLDEFALETVGLKPSDFAEIRTRLDKGDTKGARAMVTEEMRQLAVAGTPSECSRQVARVLDAGITHVSFGGPLGPDPDRAVELIATRIIPELR